MTDRPRQATWLSAEGKAAAKTKKTEKATVAAK